MMHLTMVATPELRNDHLGPFIERKTIFNKSKLVIVLLSASILAGATAAAFQLEPIFQRATQP